MTFDRESDLDNANAGMPDTRILGITKYTSLTLKSYLCNHLTGIAWFLLADGAPTGCRPRKFL